MITLTIEANTLDELRQKALDAIGFSGTAGHTMTGVLAEPDVAEIVKRTRRTKEQMAADNAVIEGEVVSEQSSKNAPANTAQSGSQGDQTDDGAGSAKSDAKVPTEEPMVDKSEDDTALDYQTDIKPAVLKVSQKHGRPGVEKLLAPYNVTNAQQIPAEKWATLLTEIEAALSDEAYV